jgi:hypothetical protein
LEDGHVPESYSAKNGRMNLSFVEGYRDPKTKKVKHNVIENLGYVDEYLDRFEDPIAHFKEVARLRTLEKKKQEAEEDVYLGYVSTNEVMDENEDAMYHLGFLPSLGMLTLNALTAADTVLVPIQCEYYALEGLSQLVETIRIVRKHLNKNLEVEGVVLTMFDARTNLSIQVVEDVKKYFKNKVYRTIIPRNVKLSEAPSHGLPIILYEPNSKGAESYMELAEEVIEAEEDK